MAQLLFRYIYQVLEVVYFLFKPLHFNVVCSFNMYPLVSNVYIWDFKGLFCSVTTVEHASGAGTALLRHFN